MIKKLILATAATALVAAPAAARDWRGGNDYRYYHRDNNGAVVGALLGAVAGAAIASSANGYGSYGYNYGYPAYGYGYGYGYPS